MAAPWAAHWAVPCCRRHTQVSSAPQHMHTGTHIGSPMITNLLKNTIHAEALKPTVHMGHTHKECCQFRLRLTCGSLAAETERLLPPYATPSSLPFHRYSVVQASTASCPCLLQYALLFIFLNHKTPHAPFTVLPTALTSTTPLTPRQLPRALMPHPHQFTCQQCQPQFHLHHTFNPHASVPILCLNPRCVVS